MGDEIRLHLRGHQSSSLAGELGDAEAVPSPVLGGEGGVVGATAQVILDGTVSPLEATSGEAAGSPALGSNHGVVRSAELSRDAVYRRSLALADALAAATALLVSMAVVGPDQPDIAALALAPLIVIVGKVIGIYDREEWLVRKSTLDEAPALFQLATLYAMIVWLINGFVITGTSDRRPLLIIWAGVFLMLLVFRATARWLCRRITPPERCLVIGDAGTCERVRSKLAGRRSLHAVVVGYVPVEQFGEPHESMAVLSHDRDLRALVSEYRAHRIVIAPERTDAEEVLNVIRTATTLGIKVSVVPRMLEVVGSSVEFDDIEGMPLLSTRRVHLSRSSLLVKRSMDVVGSALGLIVLSPLLAIMAIAIKLDSRGPVLFWQLRVGRRGEPFRMVKLRTMVVGAHGQRDQLGHLNRADGLFKIPHDPRTTRVGELLRRASLDELPQLWNVLRGDMSLVGPRPLVMEEDCRIQGWHRRRLHLTPGMTGHWQILGSARIPLDEMVKLDYLYVTNWSLWLDVKILLRTIPYIASRKGM